MSVMVEGKDAYYLGSRAYLLGDENRETASDWAVDHVTPNPAIKWVLGRYVEADKPNNNGAMWALEDLRMAQPSIQHAPMNMVHQPRNIVGAFVATEMIYPTTEESAAQQNPFIEALGAFWKAYFPDELKVVQRAHDEGQLFFSMECIAQTVTFTDPDTGVEFASFPFKGPRHESYGEYNDRRDLARRLDKPHFTAGALIIPPVKPGWTGANISELAKYVEQHSEIAQEIYDDIQRQSPEISAADCERITLELMAKGQESEENSITSGSLPLSTEKPLEEAFNADTDSLDLTEGGDEVSKTFTQEEMDAVLAKVESLSAELAELKASAEAEAVDAKIAELEEAHAVAVAELQSQLDTAVLEAEEAKKLVEDAKAFAEAEAQAWQEAAESAARKEDRLARVKEVASFPEDYLEANADRWSAMDEDSFEAALSDYAAVPKAESAAESTDTEVPTETALEGERETASEDSGSAIRGVFSLRAQGIDPKTV